MLLGFLAPLERPAHLSHLGTGVSCPSVTPTLPCTSVTPTHTILVDLLCNGEGGGASVIHEPRRREVRRKEEGGEEKQHKARGRGADEKSHAKEEGR